MVPPNRSIWYHLLWYQMRYHPAMTADKPKTAPLNDDRGELQQFTARLPIDLIERMDDRAKSVRLSRNAWIEQALDWVLTNLPTGIAWPDRDRVATAAPRGVTGDEKLPRGSRVMQDGDGAF